MLLLLVAFSAFTAGSSPEALDVAQVRSSSLFNRSTDSPATGHVGHQLVVSSIKGQRNEPSYQDTSPGILPVVDIENLSVRGRHAAGQADATLTVDTPGSGATAEVPKP